MGWWGYEKRIENVLEILLSIVCTVMSVMFFLVMASSSHAQPDQNLTSIFSLPDIEGISPPANPESSQPGQQPPSSRGQLPALRLFLLDSQTEQPLEKAHVYLDLANLQTGETVKTLKYLRNHEPLLLSLGEGNWQIIVKINTPESTGNDYYRNMTLLTNRSSNGRNETVYLNPVGSIRGMVIDNNGNIVVGAIIQFFCSSSLGEVTEQVSDDYGSFSAPWLPEGSCKVVATNGEAVGYTMSTIVRGQINDIEIVLNKEVPRRLRSFLLFIFGGLSLLFLGFALFMVMRKKKMKTEVLSPISHEFTIAQEFKQQAPEDSGRKSDRNNGRIDDILATLNAKEKEVVAYLLNENPSTQTRIRYATTIPKTTLVRIFLSLEAKKIIRVQALGKMKKIALTDWFLGKSSE